MRRPPVGRLTAGDVTRLRAKRTAGQERRTGRRFGVYPDIGLAKARDRRDVERAKVRTHKIDPLAEKRAGKARTTVPTFGKAADDYIAAHQASWKTAAYRTQWKMTLSKYCTPIRDMPVDQIDTEAVLRVLQPIWSRKPAVASMLRGRVEAILDAVRARGHIDAQPLPGQIYGPRLSQRVPRLGGGPRRRVRSRGAMPRPQGR
jgi:hypothetical protein